MRGAAAASGHREAPWRVLAGDRQSLVRLLGATLAPTFALVGVVFLLIPGRVLALFNAVGDQLGLPPSPTDAYTLYLTLAIAYMYVVTVLAVQMARHPRATAYPWVLVQAKAASALVCLVLFVAQDQYLIYIANAAVDGAIAVIVWTAAVRGSVRDDESVTSAGGVEATAPARPRQSVS